MSLKLPHISRFISASAIPVLRDFSLWSILTGLIAFNAYTALSRSFIAFQPLLIAVMRNPSSIDSHINVAHWYRQNGLLNKAKHELLLAAENWTPRDAGKPSASVLGDQASPMEMLTAWKNEPARLESSYRYWQTVIKEKPDYRDAYLALAALAYQLGYTTDAKQYVEKIREIDPNLAMSYQLSALVE